MVELTVAPSCIVAAKQLQALSAAAAAWQAEQARMQQLLLHLAAPSGGSTLTAAGASCWLVNQTGAALSYAVADAVLEPAAATAALGTADGGSGSRSMSPVKPPPATMNVAGARGQAAHLTPVPLRVLDVAAAGYFGRLVEQTSISSSLFALQQQTTSQAKAAEAVSAGPLLASSAGAGVKHSQLLYVQAAGRVDVLGPIALNQLGCSVHPLRGLSGAALSPSSLPGQASR